jgi:hypothetical protein
MNINKSRNWLIRKLILDLILSHLQLMKRSLIITIALLGFCSFIKAQSLNSCKLALIDSSKTLSNQLPQFKIDTSYNYKLQQDVPYTQMMPILPLTKVYSDFLTADHLNSNMPVVKLQSADRMPVLKLGDTETTHYTMLIKRLGNEVTNNKATP